jgi:hypothetical protein
MEKHVQAMTMQATATRTAADAETLRLRFTGDPQDEIYFLE